ncbi:hypothetical protein B6N38_07360 [Cutibacterium avidum]|nr:hypothetical protein B6N38_07360 [Cutibacterium avidum]PGX70793.1 hypothetical protein B6N39_00015 [Cutibacterium avidum]
MTVQLGIGHHRPLGSEGMTVKGFTDAAITGLISMAVLMTIGRTPSRDASFQLSPRNRRIVVTHPDHASS